MAHLSEIIGSSNPMSYPDFGQMFGHAGDGNMSFVSVLNSGLESL